MTASWTDTTDDPIRIGCLDCDRTGVKMTGRGLCARCYKRRKIAGTLGERPAELTGMDRLTAWLDTMKDERGCWSWPGAMTLGYGRIRIDGIDRQLHRVVHELLIGPIPAGLHVDHTCHNATVICSDDEHCPHRRCANPRHLEAVTSRVNVRRGHTVAAANLAKLNCPAGHPYSGDNLYVVPRTGARQCRTCNRAADRRHYGRGRSA